MEVSVFIIKRVYQAPVDLVWEVITKREHLKNWYFDFTEDWKLSIGAVFEWEAGDTESKLWLHRGEMLDIVDQKLLKHSWEYPGYSGYSVLSWNLQALNNTTTEIELTHDFTIPFDVTVKAFDRSNFEAGWTHILSINLQEYLNTLTK